MAIKKMLLTVYSIKEMVYPKMNSHAKPVRLAEYKKDGFRTTDVNGNHNNLQLLILG